MKLPSEDVCVVLTEDQIDRAKKSAAVLQIPDVSIIGNGTKVYLTVRDKKNSGSNSYSIEVGETDKKFTGYFRTENFKQIVDDYVTQEFVASQQPS